MADQNQLVSEFVIAVDLVVDLDDQRTRRVNDFQAAASRLLPDRFGDAMGTENDRLPVGHLAEFFDKNGPFQFQ